VQRRAPAAHQLFLEPLHGGAETPVLQQLAHSSRVLDAVAVERVDVLLREGTETPGLRRATISQLLLCRSSSVACRGSQVKGVHSRASRPGWAKVPGMTPT